MTPALRDQTELATIWSEESGVRGSSAHDNLLQTPSDCAMEISLKTQVEQERLHRTTGFRSIGWLPLPGAELFDPPVCLIGFDTAAFRPQAFASSGLTCPPGVRRSVIKRQAEFFFGRMAARQALTALGRPVVDIPIGTSREPVWPAGLIGSISHTAGIAAAVVIQQGTRRGVGIDIESVVDDEAKEALLATALSAQEVEHLQTTGLPLNTALTVAFSAKESLFKAAFVLARRHFDFKAARLRKLNTMTGELVLGIQEDLCAAILRGSALQLNFRLLNRSTVFTSCLC